MKIYDEYENYEEIETDEVTTRRIIKKINAVGDAIAAGLNALVGIGDGMTPEQEEALEWADDLKEEGDRLRREAKKKKFHIVDEDEDEE